MCVDTGVEWKDECSMGYEYHWPGHDRGRSCYLYISEVGFLAEEGKRDTLHMFKPRGLSKIPEALLSEQRT
jgi:hypothetical protein